MQIARIIIKNNIIHIKQQIKRIIFLRTKVIMGVVWIDQNQNQGNRFLNNSNNSFNNKKDKIS